MNKLMLTATVLLTGMIASAQNPYNLRANIPFEFRAGDATAAAGKYDIAKAGFNNGSHWRNTATRRGFLTGNAIRKYSTEWDSRLVFHKYGDRYFLREIHNGLDIQVMPESRAERSLRRDGEVPGVAFIQL